ncbi:fermentation-respiration switch protein FrsA (DUF1100 family) [Catenuloplanes nepalensis]|uniref:Fermentation-respiration switch protein FrsA (DUF1100 family) n=1 Tax=Catenuloplanes nepalensis TaxID=587533 RepID=A0ABT9MV08_9ACTN|nr:hypothetical protein [Catenuloplanes nepalensis]MDP9795091.1 fermentation-respiration switch protein FrsA (DUF1100 family) [Catenuloplanes nepalensis]
MIDALIRAGARLLPPGHRDRWREETLGLLADVHGVRRWWYAADILVKLPALRRSLSARPGRRSVPILAGLAMLGTTALIVGAPLLATVIGEDNAEALFLLAPLGLAPAVVMRATAGPRRPLRTALTIVGCGFGAVFAAILIALASAAGAAGLLFGTLIAAAVLCALAPAGWLIGTTVADLRTRRTPATLSAAGLLAGIGLTLVLFCFGVGLSRGGLPPSMQGLAILGLAVLVPAYLVWSVWTGLRLLVAPGRGTS